MHVLVTEGELVEVPRATARPQGLERFVERRGEVLEHLRAIEERQIPTGVVRHLRRIVEGISAREARRAAERVPQGPELLEPGEVAHFPRGWD